MVMPRRVIAIGYGAPQVHTRADVAVNLVPRSPPGTGGGGTGVAGSAWRRRLPALHRCAGAEPDGPAEGAGRHISPDRRAVALGRHRAGRHDDVPFRGADRRQDRFQWRYPDAGLFTVLGPRYTRDRSAGCGGQTRPATVRTGGN